MIALISLVLSACSDNQQEPTAQNSAPVSEVKTEQISKTPLLKQPEANLTSANKNDYQALRWEDLELPGQGLAEIMRKYQPLLDKVSDTDVEQGDKLMEALQNELNAAPTNPALNGKRIQLNGFVSPLEVDEQNGQIKEFLLVPYFGACIHVPPPPVNQTLLVNPQTGKSIHLEQIYEPVTVSGVLTVKASKTKLAQAGYQITEAVIEPFKEPKEGLVTDTQN